MSLFRIPLRVEYEKFKKHFAKQSASAAQGAQPIKGSLTTPTSSFKKQACRNIVAGPCQLSEMEPGVDFVERAEVQQLKQTLSERTWTHRVSCQWRYSLALFIKQSYVYIAYIQTSLPYCIPALLTIVILYVYIMYIFKYEYKCQEFI